MASSALATTTSFVGTSRSSPSNTLILSGFERSDFPPRSSSLLQRSDENENAIDSGSQNNLSSNTSPCLTSRIRNLISEGNEIPIVHWGNLRSFGRVVAVFQNAQEATQAKLVIQSLEATSGKSLKAYYDKHTPLYEVESEDNHLRLPDQGRLFFISPPPSPPAGWISQPESAPNTETFHADLHEALLGLGGESDVTEDNTSNPSGSGTPTGEATTNNLTPFPSETVISTDTGKLLRRVTLHQSQKPRLSLRTEGQELNPAFDQHEPSSPAVVTTPTIVVEWDADGENDSDHMPGDWGRNAAVTASSELILANDARPERMRPTRTERPPM